MSSVPSPPPADGLMVDVGIVGGGQLARMTVQAAIALGIDVRVLASAEGAPTALWRDVVDGEPDAATLESFSRGCDVITFEHELIDPAVVSALTLLGRRVRPGAATLRVAADKVVQRNLLADAGLPVPPFTVVHDAAAVHRFAAEHAWPVVLKTPRGGFDGRGVRLVEGPEQTHFALRLSPGPLLAEPALELQAELAVLVARRPGGESVTYPVVRTVQERGICRRAHAPSGVEPHLEQEARQLAHRVAELVDATGILAVELFVVGGQLLVNEIAARPHNSGHLTLDGCATSQFENHLRAVLDWPLGPTGLRAPAVAMANVIAEDGTSDPKARLPEALGLGPIHVHLYGKSARAGRKLGHVTVLDDDVEVATKLAADAADVLGSASATRCR